MKSYTHYQLDMKIKIVMERINKQAFKDYLGNVYYTAYSRQYMKEAFNGNSFWPTNKPASPALIAIAEAYIERVCKVHQETM